MSEPKTKVIYQDGEDAFEYLALYERHPMDTNTGIIVISTTTEPPHVCATYAFDDIADVPTFIRLDPEKLVLRGPAARQLFDFQSGNIAELVENDTELGGES